MKRTAFTCDLSNENIQVQVQEAMHYTPAVLRIEGEVMMIELLLTNAQIEAVEEVLTTYRARRLGNEGAQA